MKRALPLLVLAACAAPPGPPPPAPWPPPLGPLRVVIDADAANEIDDQYALALALGFPDRIRLEGLVAAHFGKPEHVEKSLAEIREVLKRAGREVDVAPGCPPLASTDDAPSSPGVELILDRARSATPADPLWLVLLGPATDAVAALRRDPSIADRVVVFWHSRSEWPVRCRNFNAKNDVHATRALFELPCRLVLFDTGAHLRIRPEDGERRFGGLGPLGAYLVEIRKRSPRWLDPGKGIFDLGDLAALIDFQCAVWERSPAPAVTADLLYDFERKGPPLVRIGDVKAERCFELLEEALRTLAK